MERAAGGVIGTGFFERHTSVHNIDNVNAVQKFLNKALRNQSYLLLPKNDDAIEYPNEILAQKQKRSFTLLVMFA